MTRQTAAGRTVPAGHPVLAARSVQSYYQDRQRVHSNVASGVCQTRLLHAREGHASPDLAVIALPDHQSGSRRVEIRGLLDDRLIKRWRVPSRPFIGWEERDGLLTAWGWGPGSDQLVLPFEPEGAAESGLMFLNVQSGACQTVLLGQTDFTAAPVAYHTGRGLALVQHATADQPDLLSVYDCRGDLVVRIPAPVSDLQWFSWAPSGLAVALASEFHRLAGSCLWLWDVSSSAPVFHRHGLTWIAWATPSPARLLVGSLDQPASVFMLDGQQTVQGLSLQHDAQHLSEAIAAWGSRLCLYNRKQETGYEVMELYSMQDSQLVLDSTLSLSGRRFVGGQLHLTADGELCAALTAAPAEGAYSRTRLLDRPCLALIHLASGSLREYPLHADLADTTSVWSMRVAWSPDCTFVLVAAEFGLDSQLFTFA